ncbi:MAG: LysM peptidoglycan-binding domain-containing protein [Dehalococcoidia bacterium]|nr:LysM peptidoglycan-binding domain-containing protein [Dehalococcoidia bacterium]
MMQRTTLLATAASLVLLAACGGDDSPDPTPPPGSAGTVPTATPFPTEPVPTIVTGEGSGSTGGSAETSYEVQPGDTLSGIAESYGVTVEDIQAANDLSGTDIFVGQELTIPGADGGASDGGGAADGGGTAPVDGGTPTPQTATPPPSTGDGETYTVQPGDTAIGIADQFGVTVEELAAANGVSVDEIANLFAGQDIQIPGGD